MLTTYLKSTPYSKFVLIQDSAEESGKGILKYLVDLHLKANCKVKYFTFEGCFAATKKFYSHPSVQCYDFVSDAYSWLGASGTDLFPAELDKQCGSDCVVVIDSLAHAVFHYGVAVVYKVLQRLLVKNRGLTRLIAVLHQDVCEDLTQTTQYFEHLSTLSLVLQPGVNRIAYLYKKVGGKPVKKIEQYKLKNGVLQTEPVKKPDPKSLVQESLGQTLPENLSTFKISLSDREKESRASLVLPYLPKEKAAASAGDAKQGDAKIFYNFDNVDDWDEEDPDDDLDI